MKRVFIIAMLVCYAITGFAQNDAASKLLGAWTGILPDDQSQHDLTLVFHFKQTDSTLKVTMDSPDQSLKGIPCEVEFLPDDSLVITYKNWGITYHAHLNDDKIEGTYIQGGWTAPLVLTKGEIELKRPQHPIPPYPYKTEDVTFRNEADSATLAGTICWPVGYNPKSKRKPTVVLFVTGSGLENRDEEIYDHKFFLVIADYLARHGIASLRYDDRATGASVGGDIKNATSEDFAHDAAAGLEFLRNMNAFSKVGLIGHSEGGLIGFLLSGQGLTDFLVSMAGTGVKGDIFAVSQHNRLMEILGKPDTMTVENIRQQPVFQKVPWYKWLLDYDPSENISKTLCPVFALNGDRDQQVISSLNLTAIENLLPKSKKNLIKEYPELNHLFQHCTTGLTYEHRGIEETISPEVLKDIADWINGLGKIKKRKSSLSLGEGGGRGFTPSP